MIRLILLPGLDGTGDLFAEFVRHKPVDIETGVISYPLSQPLTYPECVAHVARSLPKNEEFVLLGESFSGLVSIALAAQSPPGLRGLILCNTFACPPAWSGFRFFPWRLTFHFPIPRLLAGYALVGFAHATAWVKRIRAANRKVLPKVRASRMTSLFTIDVRAELAKVRVPILDLRGTRDHLVGSRSARVIRTTHPEVEIAEIDGPHLVLQIAPEACWKVISKFVSTMGSHASCVQDPAT